MLLTNVRAISGTETREMMALNQPRIQVNAPSAKTRGCQQELQDHLIEKTKDLQSCVPISGPQFRPDHHILHLFVLTVCTSLFSCTVAVSHQRGNQQGSTFRTSVRSQARDDGR
jgi:hypothetical protein